MSIDETARFDRGATRRERMRLLLLPSDPAFATCGNDDTRVHGIEAPNDARLRMGYSPRRRSSMRSTLISPLVALTTTSPQLFNWLVTTILGFRDVFESAAEGVVGAGGGIVPHLHFAAPKSRQPRGQSRSHVSARRKPTAAVIQRLELSRRRREGRVSAPFASKMRLTRRVWTWLRRPRTHEGVGMVGATPPLRSSEVGNDRAAR